LNINGVDWLAVVQERGHTSPSHLTFYNDYIPHPDDCKLHSDTAPCRGLMTVNYTLTVTYTLTVNCSDCKLH